MYESRLRKRKTKEPELQEEDEVVEKVTKTKKVRTATKKNNKTTKEEKKVELELADVSEPDLDLTKTCPNEIIVHILSFLTYKEVLGTWYDKRWAALGNSREVWGVFCRKMRWNLPFNNKKMTYKELYKRRIVSKSYCSSCGNKTSAKFPLLQITLCPSCRNREPEFATLNKTESKAQYFLDEFDLSKVKFVISNVGWGRKKYVYLKSDIEAAAFAKYGGEEGFEKEKVKRNQIKQSKFNILAQKKERRAQDLEDHLASIAWAKTFAIGPRKFPILLPNELLNDDYERYLRAPVKGNPTSSFASIFVLNCHRYLNTGFGAMFVENMPLLDAIAAYLTRERDGADNTAPSSATTTAPTTTTTSTTTTTTTSTTQDPPTTTPTSSDAHPSKSPATSSEIKRGVNGDTLTTYAGATFDAELRKFYLNIIYARIEQIWQHPGRFDIEPEATENDDHMGVLFDKKSHFSKRLRTPNNILEQIYADARAVMNGHLYDSDDDESDDDDDIMSTVFDLFGGNPLCACCTHHPFGNLFGDYDSDDSDSDDSDSSGMSF